MSRKLRHIALRPNRSIVGDFRLLVERHYGVPSEWPVHFDTEDEAVGHAAEIASKQETVTTITILQCRPVHRISVEADDVPGT